MKIPTQKPSSVEAHEFDPKTGHLTVTFRGGRKYRYEGVDKQIAAGLASAPSKGTFLHSRVIGKHTVTKL